jgi:hypothetical protein
MVTYRIDIDTFYFGRLDMVAGVLRGHGLPTVFHSIHDVPYISSQDSSLYHYRIDEQTLRELKGIPGVSIRKIPEKSLFGRVLDSVFS